MTRKRWITAGAAIAVLCLVLGIMGVAFAARDIPGVARLFRGGPPAPTAIPITERKLADFLPTATLTPTPTPTEVPPSPTQTLSATATASRPTDPPATATSLPVTPSPTPTPPTVTPRPQWIAFESQRGEYNDYEIMVMATNGSRLTNLTRSWADDVAPAWSPDGKWIAFVSLRDTASGKAELESGNLYMLPFDPAAGKATGEAVRLTDFPGAEGWPAWSPDGKKIAFHSDIDGNFDIWVMNVAPLAGGTGGTGLVNLTRDGAEDKFPAWSPDGKKIAFASMRTGNHDIWVMNADGSNPTNLTQHPARDRYPIWSPNGKQMTFNTDRDRKQEVYMMNSDGSGLKNITNTPKHDEGLADWSPDGRRLLLYSEQQHDKDIYIVDLKTGKWTNITNSPTSDEYCAWWP